MVWQHPDDALQNDAKFELVVKYFGLGEGGTIDNPGEWWNNLIDMERSSPFTNQDPFETWTLKLLIVRFPMERIEWNTVCCSPMQKMEEMDLYTLITLN